ncbi:hypothetical protein MRQ36_27845 [Micromonospora sp. R77]|uniref:hypothetical protein n=1 Tax=Micromonospora sp. R77 TaxID=2925836 RepID=UPI001F619EB1|nr:hypothetical protein [Micromonospora sp. R77]MCI4066155.1 hypothetical protein [Micromonospora sp. R77]
MSWPRRVIGAALLTAVLVLPPWLLARYAGSLLPGWPTGEQLRTWIADPLTARTLTAGLAAGAWLLWLGVAYTVAVTAGRRLRAGARWVRHLPLPTPWQAAATSMAGAAALTTVHTPALSPPNPPQPMSTDGLHHLTPLALTGEGVRVPGGWLPDDTARQVTAAAALVWLRRRRAYQPGQNPDGSPLTPLPDTVTAVQAAVADRPQPPATSTASAVPDLPAAGVAFTGDGAADAARGVLVTRLLAALRDPPDTVLVVITRTCLTTLLPDLAPAPDTIPGLQVADTVEDATALLTFLADPTTPSRDGGVLPIPVLITTPPSAATANQLATLTAARARVVTLGEGPFGSVWSVDRHGHTRDAQTGQPGPRLCVLDRTAATDLLTVVAHHTITVPDPTATTAPVTPQAADGVRAWIPRQPGRDTPRTITPLATPPAIQLQVLGRPALLVDGRPVTIRRSAALQVLVILAVQPDGATTTQLVQAIWPGLPTHTVTGRLYTTLSDLRSTVRAATTLTVLATTDDRYHLNPEHVDVDLWRLHTATHDATTTLTNPTPAWQTVIDAYTGDLAAGHTWPWIDPPREATRRLVLDAYANLAAAHTDPHDRLRFLQDAIRVDPYNQALHQQAADELTALGDPAAAHRLLHTHRQLLKSSSVPATDLPVGTRR